MVTHLSGELLLAQKTDAVTGPPGNPESVPQARGKKYKEGLQV